MKKAWENGLIAVSLFYGLGVTFVAYFAVAMSIFYVVGCGDEGSLVNDELPSFSLNKSAHEATYDAASTPHVPRGIQSAPPIPDTGWTPESIDQWEQMELEGLKKQLNDNLLTEAMYQQLVAQVHEDAQHQRDRLLNIDYHIYIVPDPENELKNRRGWEVDVVYGIPMTEDDFQITISGTWEVQDFSSTERDDGAYDVYFFLASKSRRGIIDWRGLVQSIALDGNTP